MNVPTSPKLTEGKQLKRQDIVFCLAGGPESSLVHFGSSDASVYSLDLSAEKPEPEALEGDHLHTSYVTGLAATSFETLVSGSYDRRLIWWNTESGRSIRAIDHAHGKWIRKVKASPDGRIIASVADDMVCRLWDAETGKLIRELKGHGEQTPHHYPSMLFTCEFSPDGSRLATADKVGHIKIWDIASGEPVTSLDAPVMYTWDPVRRRHSIGGIRSLAFSPDGATLAVGGMGQVGNIDHLQGKARIRLFDWEKGETRAEVEASGIKGLVERMVFHPKGDWLLACGGDHKGFALFIDLAAGKTILEEKKPPFHVHDFALDPEGRSFLAVGHNQIGLLDCV